jgi:hypothetical protein
LTPTCPAVTVASEVQEVRLLFINVSLLSGIRCPLPP